uniref:Uncharacterized protein n=1 Tax=Oryza brachyantha TaxID=4533 RepID=J3M615_ORYBR
MMLPRSNRFHHRSCHFYTQGHQSSRSGTCVSAIMGILSKNYKHHSFHHSWGHVFLMAFSSFHYRSPNSICNAPSLFLCLYG